jgi:hypothetical protein
VESEENGQRHTDVHDDNPWPHTKELELQRIGVSSRLFQRIDRPHSKIAHLHKKKGKIYFLKYINFIFFKMMIPRGKSQLHVPVCEIADRQCKCVFWMRPE